MTHLRKVKRFYFPGFQFPLIFGRFSHVSEQDRFLLTSKRLLTVDRQGFSGKKQVPHAKNMVRYWFMET